MLSYIKSLIAKLLVFTIIFYAILISVSLAVTAYLFLNLNSYKHKIEEFVKQKTGYILTIQHIETKLSNHSLPELVLDGATISNPVAPSTSFTLNNLQLALSYRSIWNLQPIFDQITLNGANCNLVYHSDGTLSLNGLLIYNPEVKTHSSFDIKQYILKQTNIVISNFNFSFTDEKHALPPLMLNLVNTRLHNGFNDSHYLTANIDGTPNNIGQYQAISLNTTLIADKLRSFNAIFTINTSESANSIKESHLTQLTYPKFIGEVNITPDNDNNYNIKADNLSIITAKGYILQNKAVLGNYKVIPPAGHLSMYNTNIANFNNLLAILPINNNFSLSGILDVIKFSWNGNLFAPQNLLLAIKFNNLAIHANNSNIPSINNINGDILVSKESGTLNLHLCNSTFSYLKVFRIPFNFTTLDSQINWQIAKNHVVNVSIAKTNVVTKDFTAIVYGKYIYTPGTHGYLNLKARIDKMFINRVAVYLPLVIGKSAHKWLDMGLIGGVAKNASFSFDGNLADFPFKNNKGVFKLDVDAENAQIDYIHGWPTLNKLFGTFQLRNEQLIVNANEGRVAGTKITHAKVTIPDISAHQIHLTVDGQVSGQTNDFMHYLSQTPLNKLIGNLPDKTTTSGSGNLSLKLDIPLISPTASKVNGAYTFNHNNIIFKHLPVPPLTNVNGVLAFNEHGVNIKSITVDTLDSNAKLSATTNSEGNIKFTILVNALDYQQLVRYYLPFIAPVIHGNAITTINFTINKTGIAQISANSKLTGVTLNIPEPLNKPLNKDATLEFMMLPNVRHGYNINFAYSNNSNTLPAICQYNTTAANIIASANLLCGNVSLNHNGQLEHVGLSLGTPLTALPVDTNNHPLILIGVNLTTLDALAWINTILPLAKAKSETITSISQGFESSSTIITSTKIQQQLPHKSSQNIFPIEVLVDTNNLHLHTHNFLHANADMLMLNDKTVFNLSSTLTSGFGNFAVTNNTLDIHLNQLNLQKTIASASKTNPRESSISQHNVQHTEITESAAIALLTSNIDESQALHMAKISKATTLSFPKLQLIIDNLYYEHAWLARGQVRFIPSGHNLIIESGTLNGNTTYTSFFGTNYCMDCKTNQAYVKLHINMEMHDLGLLLENLHFGKVIAKGNGNINILLRWPGTLEDFDIKQSIAKIDINIKNGKFLKVDTGSVLGEVLGIINLQSISNIANLSLKDAFTSGFYFNELKIKAYLINNKLEIKSMRMAGPLALVNSYGTIDIKHDSINTYLIITPKLGTGVAIGAGIVATPVVGVLVYAGEWLLGQPIDKLFNFSYHITGTLEKPILSKLDISRQVLENLAGIISDNK